MAKYKKRPDGRYATSTIVGYTDDGKPKRKNTVRSYNYGTGQKGRRVQEPAK